MKVVGEVYDIKDLFCLAERDFLVRKDGSQVKIDSLKGKIICIYYANLYKDCEDYIGISLFEVYDKLRANEDFEIILVATVKNGGSEETEIFNKHFSKMPWLAVPFHDTSTRNRLNKLVERVYFQSSKCLILDAEGKCLRIMSMYDLNMYGAECYPFTQERFDEIDEDDSIAYEKMSLKSLLVSPSRDFVLSHDGTKVPIAELEGKVIGLYLYGPPRTQGFMQKFINVYQELKYKGESFEIVFVNLHFFEGYTNEEEFNRRLKSMPWLALPFMDNTCRKLFRIFYDLSAYKDDDTLIVIGHHGKVIERFAATVIENYGAPAYPFTRKKAEELEMKRLRSQTLQSILISGRHTHLIQKTGGKIPASNISGKTIFLFLSSQSYERRCEFLPELIGWYKKMKERDDEFEVIYVSDDDSQKGFDEFYSEMLWPAFPYDNGCLYSLLNEVFKFRLSTTLMAFGRDGRLQLRKAHLKLEKYGPHNAFPFTEDDFSKEIGLDLAIEMQWAYLDENGDEFDYDMIKWRR